MGGITILKRLVLGISVGLTIVLSPVVSTYWSNFGVKATATEKDELRKKAIKFRETYGMDTSETYIEHIIQSEKIDDDFERVHGTPVTESEMKVYEKRMKQIDETHKVIEKFKTNYSHIYAGGYYNAKSGKAHIQLAKEEDVTEFIKNEIDFPEDVIIEYVEYSENELLSLQNLLQLQMRNNANLLSLGIDVYSNKLLVGLKDLNEETMSSIKVLVENPNMLKFEQIDIIPL
ncbi:hypothetical protein J2T17_004335 [Paenibacillus mucilaginosus]|uniref:hypothetical protein n=1 Tax=Paenibacillus mucilaginosus TaxID=61624 RepID=UPI003D198AA8